MRTLAAVLLSAALGLGVLAPSAPAVVNGTSSGLPGYMAFVLTEAPAGSYRGCGGTAISPNVVLTAAHCVVDASTNSFIPVDRVSALLGQQDPLGALDRGQAVRDPVLAYTTPTSYRASADGGSVNDVALLQLRDPATTTLPLVPQGRTSLWSPGTAAAVLGWGRTIGTDPDSEATSVQFGGLTIGSSAACAQRIAGFNASVMLCGTGTGPAIPCQGDSGGPLLVQDPETNALNQAGVISFGAPGCAAGSAPVFANVAAPALGVFVATNAAKLQAAADALRQAASSAPLAAPPATPAPAPAFTATQALQRMKVVLRQATGRVPVITRTGCSRVDGATFRCAPTWHDRTYDYRGRLTIAPDRVRFDGERASRRCRQARAWSSCARTYRFT